MKGIGLGKLCVVVSDRGPGLDLARLDRQGIRLGGLGRFSIRERMTDFGSKLQLDSAPPSPRHPDNTDRPTRLTLLCQSRRQGVALFVDSEPELTFILSAVEMDFRFYDPSVANSRRVIMPSFRPECDDGVDLGGTARGNEAGNE